MAGLALGQSTQVTRQAAETAYRSFGRLERLQLRGRAAVRALGTELGTLEGKLDKLAFGSIAVDAIDRAGRSVLEPLHRSIEQAASFQRGMTGIGILADLPAPTLKIVSANIVQSAQRLAIPIAQQQQDDMAVLNEGVYRTPADLIIASNSAARLALVAEAGGAPLSGAEAAAAIATYSHALNAPAEMIERLNATMFRASQIEGVRVGNAARFMPEIMGQMKLRAFGNFQGFVDANAGIQIVKRIAGTDEAAGVDMKDFMASLSHTFTTRRFAKMGSTSPTSWRVRTPQVSRPWSLRLRPSSGKSGRRQQTLS